MSIEERAAYGEAMRLIERHGMIAITKEQHEAVEHYLDHWQPGGAYTTLLELDRLLILQDKVSKAQAKLEYGFGTYEEVAAAFDELTAEIDKVFKCP